MPIAVMATLRGVFEIWFDEADKGVKFRKPRYASIVESGCARLL